MKIPVISSFLSRRRERQALRDLSNLASVFQTYDRLESAHLLHFEQKRRQLFIEQPLAVLMMRDADSWSNFLKGIHLWQYDRECRAAWDAYMQKEELAAIREAAKNHAALTPADRDRIRRARREQIALSDVKPPVIPAFDYFIIRETAAATVPDAAASGKIPLPSAEVLAVGHYDPDSGLVEIASWDDVAQFMSAH